MLLDPFWQRVPLHDVARTAGTPVVVMSEERLRANVRDLFAGLGGEVTLRYCAKTNPELRLLQVVREEGMHVLVSHAAEARLAVAAGFAPERIAFQRPVLEDRELDAVIDLGIRRVHAFRASDLDLLARAAGRKRVTLRVSLRIALRRSGMAVLSAVSRRLGFDPTDVAIRPRQGLIVDALNTYIGTQQEEVEAFRPALRALVRIAARLGTIEELNLGGGVPSHTLRRVTPARVLRRDATPPGPPLLEYAKALRGLFDEEATSGMRLALEPGRSIAGNAAVLLTRVAATQGRWRFLDCGRNVLAESPLGFTRAISLLDAGPRRTAFVHFSGPTLNTLDVVEMGRRMPEPREGDLVVLADAGAYALARAVRYAGLSPAAVMVRGDGSMETVRRAEGYDELVSTMEMQ